MTVVYDFEEINDELPLHDHTDKDIHFSIIARGKILAFGPEWEKEVSAGVILDWEPGQPHGFKALEPNSRLVNVLKNNTATESDVNLPKNTNFNVSPEELINKQ